MKHLKTLILDYNQNLNDYDLKAICSLYQLKNLSLMNCSLSQNQLAYLRMLGDLECLNLDLNPGLSYNDIQEITNLRKLRLLSLSGSILDQDIVSGFKNLVSLETLYFNRNLLSVKVMQEIIQIPSLKNLYLNKCTRDNDVLNLCKFLKNLKLLSLQCNSELSQVEFDGFTSLQHLEELDLTMAGIKGRIFTNYGSMFNLKILKINSFWYMEDLEYEFLISLNNLRILELPSSSNIPERYCSLLEQKNVKIIIS